MKKNIALTLIAGMASSGLFAQNVFADNLYMGARAGQSFSNDACSTNHNCNDDDPAAGLFLGYDVNQYMGVELGADWLGKYDLNYMDNGTLSRSEHNLSAITLAPKFSYPMSEKVDVYAKVGAAYMQYGDDSDYVPTGTVGAEYHISKKWDARLAYQRYEGMSDHVMHDMDTDLVTVGLSYNFGQDDNAAPMPAKATEPAPAPQPKAEPAPKPQPKPKWVMKQHNDVTDKSFFELDSAKLTDSGKEALAPLLATLKEYPKANANIVGYTDTTGTKAYNKQLSKKRAQSVADYLVENGIDKNKLTVDGKGEADPIASNATRQGREQNRRVEVTIPEFEYKVKTFNGEETTTKA